MRVFVYVRTSTDRVEAQFIVGALQRAGFPAKARPGTVRGHWDVYAVERARGEAASFVRGLLRLIDQAINSELAK